MNSKLAGRLLVVAGVIMLAAPLSWAALETDALGTSPKPSRPDLRTAAVPDGPATDTDGDRQGPDDSVIRPDLPDHPIVDAPPPFHRLRLESPRIRRELRSELSRRTGRDSDLNPEIPGVPGRPGTVPTDSSEDGSRLDLRSPARPDRSGVQ